MSTPGGRLVDSTAYISYSGCSPNWTQIKINNSKGKHAPLQVETTGQKEYDCRAHQGYQQPSPEWDTRVETPTINLVGYKTTGEEIFMLYQEVYQLKRAPRVVLCSQKMAEEIHLEILDMLKEHLHCRWGPALLAEEWRQALTGIRTTRMPAQAEFHAWMQATYDHYKNMWQDSCGKALVRAWDAHCQVLAAAAILEGHIERLSCSVSHRKPSSQGQLDSHQHLHSRRCTRSCRRHPLADQKVQGPSVAGHTGDPAKRQAPSPSPVRCIRHITFEENSTESDTSVDTQEMSDRSEPSEGDLGLPPSLKPNLEHFLGGHPSQQDQKGENPRWDPPPKPPLDDYCKWIEWHGQCVDMPAWWRELQVIPVVEDHWELAQKVMASFKVPMVLYQAGGGKMTTLPCWPQNAWGKIGSCYPRTHGWVGRIIT